MILSSLTRAKIIWSPTTYNHDPNPPLPLEDAPPAGDGQPTVKRFGGVAFAYSNNSQGGRVWEPMR